MPDSPRPADAALLDDLIQTMRDVEWSVALDCLHHETLTPHGRQVLTDAPDLLSRLAARLSETREAGEERYWCGCVRAARWTRCAQHQGFEHDEEPPSQRAEYPLPPSGPSTGETTP